MIGKLKDETAEVQYIERNNFVYEVYLYDKSAVLREKEVTMLLRTNLGSSLSPAFFIFLFDIYVFQSRPFLLDSQPEIWQKSYGICAGFALSSRTTFPQQKERWGIQPLIRKKKLPKKEGRFYTGVLFIQTLYSGLFLGIPSLWFFPTSQNSCEQILSFHKLKVLENYHICI